jgi:hypothetical protein
MPLKTRRSWVRASRETKNLVASVFLMRSCCLLSADALRRTEGLSKDPTKCMTNAIQKRGDW